MLNFQNNKIILAFLTVLVAAVILFWAIISGWNKGKDISQTEAVLRNFQALTKAAEYFHSDQERFPTAIEFAEKNSFGVYLNFFPVPEYISKICGQSYSYKRLDPQSYEISFCLPLAKDDYAIGWNHFKSNK